MDQPHWLDHAFLEKHLKSYYNENELKVHGFESKLATVKGEGFCGSLYRVAVTFVISQNDKVCFIEIINEKLFH